MSRGCRPSGTLLTVFPAIPRRPATIEYSLGVRRHSGTSDVQLTASIFLFWRTHRDLGANWSPTLEIGAQHTLVTRGVYGRIRHPMYASQALLALAQALLLPNWVAGLAGPLAFLARYLIRVPREERMMLDHFGDAYRAYSAHTGRILPRLHR
ncbi:MAG: isoprenylcysteine carboxylmethyltransferase family protein [Chloroflexi bacterium]|nr:isoprenylcysteine carboxylmethyltransferase family protein [Chloroflexota bacterium]